MYIKADKAIAGGLIVADGEIRPATILISGDKIVEVLDPEARYKAEEIIEVKGKIVLPGLIDAHLHPVYIDRIDSLSRAAAAEGITTLIPYVGAVKAWGVDKPLAEAMQDFIQEGENSSSVDFSLHCTMLEDDVEGCETSIPAMISLGIVSFKVFMAYRKRGMMLGDEQLLKIMTVIAEHKGLLAAHAENGALIDYMEEYFNKKGQAQPKYYPASHPELSEAEAVFRLLSLARTAGCDVYLPHLSTSKALDIVRLFKQWECQTFYTETCPHYLLLNESVYEKMGSIAKMSPPLRKAEDQKALWQAIEDGIVDVIASDHAGSLSKEKMPQWDKVFSAPNGVPGMECLVPLMLHEGVKRGSATLIKLVEQLSEKPARIFGLYPKKGAITKGSDADIAIFDLNTQRLLGSTHPELKIDYSLYEGMTVTAPPELVLLRGQVIAQRGVVCGEAGGGKFVAGTTNTLRAERQQK